MGADGGVCWVPLKDSGKYDRAVELIRPFYSLLSSGMADWQEDACSDWEDKNPWCSPPKYIQGYYGSFQDFDLTQLADTLNWIEDDIEDVSITFGELLEDLATRPLVNTSGEVGYLHPPSIPYVGLGLHDFRGRYLSFIERLLWESFGWRFGEDEDSFAPIKNMKVVDWAKELRSICDWNKCDSEETWT